jgi:hypothetical protein
MWVWFFIIIVIEFFMWVLFCRLKQRSNQRYQRPFQCLLCLILFSWRYLRFLLKGWFWDFYVLLGCYWCFVRKYPYPALLLEI